MGRVLVAIAVLVLAPWAGAKVVMVAVLAAACADRWGCGATCDRRSVARGLLGAGLLAIVVTPVWSVAPTLTGRVVGLLATVFAVALWSRATAVSLRPGTAALDRRLLPLVGVAAVFLAGPNLFGPIEFRGDEDVHLMRPLRALEFTGRIGIGIGWPYVAAILIVVAVSLFLLRRRSATVLRFAAPLAACVAALIFLVRPLAPEMELRLVRYPALGAWIQTLLAFSPVDAFARFEHVRYEEGLYRLSSFAAALILGFIGARFAGGGTWFRLSAAILLITTPTASYFASTAYPDFLAAAVSVVGVALLYVWTLKGLRSSAPGSFSGAILAIALLIKESLVPVVASLAATAAVAKHMRSRARRPPAEVLAEVFADAKNLGVRFLTPCAIYVVWRLLAERWLQGGRSMRGFGFDPRALVNPHWAEILLGAWWVQFSALLLFAAVAVLIRRRRLLVLSLLIPPAIAQIVMLNTEFVVDTPLGLMPQYVGFARYQLALLPVFVWLGILGIREAGRRSRRAAWVLVAIGIAWNMTQRPVHGNGVREAFWGDYGLETSGERYPYDELFSWFAARGERRPITIVGRDYSYLDAFYLRQSNLEAKVIVKTRMVPRSPLVVRGGPPMDSTLAAMEHALSDAEDAEGPVVMHVSPWVAAGALPDRVGRLELVREFRLGAQALRVYEIPAR